MAERPEDLNLPLSVVTRLVKEALPDGVNLSKEARVALARSASVFVLYLTSSANMLANKDKRSTIRGQDVFKALDETDFSHFEEPLKEALNEFQKTVKDKKVASEQRKQQRKSDANKEAAVSKESEQADEEIIDLADDGDN
ncbi:DNA polymerase epsilon subunit 3 [Neocloeon triangulifer]|uniref:DNA polymerase epsilon subunit 3 n=1 Tax=Neocloeon triangulifer TaxID=2078957 RepID=UPI00286F1ED2|nr:DNA polymerase epsilon subunit 3 [Neocloeon triangulifer]